MSDIHVLKEIGLQEVSKRTHIEVKTLQYMLDKEFDKLGRINTLGFVKIISREYHLDLSAWQEEFEAYWSEKSGQMPSKTEAVFAVNAPSGSKRSIFKSKIFLLTVVIAIAFGVRYFDLWEKAQPLVSEKIAQWNQSEEIEPPATQEEEVSYTTPSVVNEAQKILEEETFEVNESLVTQELNSTQEENLTQIAPMEKEDNQTQITQELIPDATIETEQVQELEPEPKEVPTEQAEPEMDNKEYSGAIKPNVNIWVGVVYLDNKKRASYLTDENIKLDLSREQIITTGHGNFTLEVNDNEDPFEEELPKRFHWDGKEMKVISYDQFVELNGGSSW